jgi:hypothetical protein
MTNAKAGQGGAGKRRADPTCCWHDTPLSIAAAFTAAMHTVEVFRIQRTVRDDAFNYKRDATKLRRLSARPKLGMEEVEAVNDWT